MGTSASTRLLIDGATAMTLFTQCDGYPLSWGRELQEALLSYRIVNGTQGDVSGVANGIDDLYLLAVSDIKKRHGAGTVYLTVPQNDPKCTTDYSYEVDGSYQVNHGLTIKVSRREDVIYSGSLEEFKYNED